MQSSVSVPGVPVSCYNWDVVQIGVDCQKLAQDNGITLAQLLLWNTDIDENCDNLRVGYA